MPPFKKGQSGNPAGRPVGATSYRTQIQGAFIAALEKKGPGKNDKQNFIRFLETFMNEAVAHPDSKAATFVAERLFSGDILNQIDATLQRDRRADLDFMAYRIRKPCFNVQQRVLDSKEPLVMLMCGRRAGKTEVDTRLAAQAALVPGSKVLFIAMTFTRAVDLFWNNLCALLRELNVIITRESRTEGLITIDNGSEFSFHGNSTVNERDRLRGGKYNLVIIDEAQSQPALPYLVEEIVEPMLKDAGGRLVLSGTGPKVRGTWWEQMWLNEDKYKGLRLNWNLSINPYIKDYKTVLEAVLKEKSWQESDPVFQTEYLGQISYDDNALVYRLSEQNYYSTVELEAWVKSQPASDIKFVVGIDYGFVDSTAIVCLVYSTHKPEVYVIYEKKFNRSGVTEVVQALDECVMAMNDAPFKSVPEHNKKLIGYADTAGGMQSVSYELSTKHGFNILPAIKDNKAFAVEQLQEEVRLGTLKLNREGPFADEAMKIIFGRDDTGNLTREIDDSYHPDSMDALLYAFRHLWTSYPQRRERPVEVISQLDKEEREFFKVPNKLRTT